MGAGLDKALARIEPHVGQDVNIVMPNGNEFRLAVFRWPELASQFRDEKDRAAGYSFQGQIWKYHLSGHEELRKGIESGRWVPFAVVGLSWHCVHGEGFEDDTSRGVLLLDAEGEQIDDAPVMGCLKNPDRGRGKFMRVAERTADLRIVPGRRVPPNQKAYDAEAPALAKPAEVAVQQGAVYTGRFRALNPGLGAFVDLATDPPVTGLLSLSDLPKVLPKVGDELRVVVERIGVGGKVIVKLA